MSWSSASTHSAVSCDEIHNPLVQCLVLDVFIINGSPAGAGAPADEAIISAGGPRTHGDNLAESIAIVLGQEDDGRWWADIESMPG